jgi:hypothetical protein
VPAAVRLVTRPGTAATVRPRSAAKSAVVSEPDRSAASTMTVTSASAATSRLRATKHQRNAREPGGSSETMQPRSVMSRCSARLLGG